MKITVFTIFLKPLGLDRGLWCQWCQLWSEKCPFRGVQKSVHFGVFRKVSKMAKISQKWVENGEN